MSTCVSHPQLEWKARDEVLGEIAAHSGIIRASCRSSSEDSGLAWYVGWPDIKD